MTFLHRNRYLTRIATCLIVAWAGTAVGASSPPEKGMQAVLAAMRAASGGDRWNRVGEMRLDADLILAGMPGHERIRIDLRNGRYAILDQAGPASQAHGFDGHRAWTLDEKGLVTIRDGVRGSREAITEAYVLRQGWLRPHAAPAQMHDLGLHREHDRSYRVIEAVPRGGLPVQIWVDPRTLLPASTRIRSASGEMEITRYSDFRQVDGVKLPFGIRTGTAAEPDQQVVRVTYLSTSRQAQPKRYAIPASKVRDARILGARAPAHVPFEDYAGLILVHVSLDGGKPLPFVLDSGGLNLLTPTAAKQLGLQGRGDQSGHGVGPETASLKMAPVRRVRLGRVELDNQRFFIVPLPLLMTDRGDRSPIAGLIGYEVLRRFVVRIDYDRHLLTLERPDMFDARQAGHAVRLRFDERTPQIEAEADGARGMFLIDTGNSGSVSLTGAFADRHRIDLGDHARGGMASGVGGSVRTRSGDIRTFSLGGFALHDQPASIIHAERGVLATDGLAGNIGYRVLSNFLVTFDYPHRRMYLQPGKRFDRPAPENRAGTGLAVQRLDHRTLQVIAVAADSTAATAGLAVGDRITAIDGIAVDRMGLDRLLEHLQGAPGHPVRFRVQRGDAPARDVRVVRTLPGHDRGPHRPQGKTRN